MAVPIVGNERVLMVGIPDSAGVLDYVALESETSSSYSSETEEVDFAAKFDRHAKSGYGQASDSLSMEAYGIRGRTTAQRRLVQAKKNREYVYFRKGEWDGVNVSSLRALEENYGMIASIEQESGLNEAQSFSVESTLQDDWVEIEGVLTVTPATATLTSTSTSVQLAVTDESGVDRTSASTYASSNTAVATVNASGLVSRVAVGTATITATYIEGDYTSTGTSAITVSS